MARSGCSPPICASSSGSTTDGNALHGQTVEVTRFYAASGIACTLYDGETGEQLFDPSE